MRILKAIEARFHSPARSGPRQPSPGLRSKGLALFAPVALIAALAALPAFAQAATVTLHEGSKTGAALKVGAAVVGTSSNLVFKTEEEEAGKLECTNSVVKGTVKKNTAEPAEGEITSGSFTGAEAENRCKTTILSGLVSAKVEPTGLPWFIRFFSNGTTTITGTPVVDFKAHLFVGSSEIAHCDYEAASIADSFSFNVALGDKIGPQTMTLNAAESSASGCSKKGTLTGTFTIKTAGGAAVVPTTP